jgi:hypothetical protein
LLSLTGGKREELLKSLSSKTGGSNFSDKSLQQMKKNSSEFAQTLSEIIFPPRLPKVDVWQHLNLTSTVTKLLKIGGSFFSSFIHQIIFDPSLSIYCWM